MYLQCDSTFSLERDPTEKLQKADYYARTPELYYYIKNKTLVYWIKIQASKLLIVVTNIPANISKISIKLANRLVLLSRFVSFVVTKLFVYS